MDDELAIDTWMGVLIAALDKAFGERLVFVGLQGSRARNEAREDSDIDAVVIIRDLSPDDLDLYKDVLGSLPCADIVCGFVSSPTVLAHWPRSDSFSLVMDTTAYYGSLDFMNACFTADEAMKAARAGASNIYHAVCHGMLFDGDEFPAIVAACVKSAFFVMRAQHYAATGEYPESRRRMRELSNDRELVFLDAYDDPDSFDPLALARDLMMWSSGIITSDPC